VSVTVSRRPWTVTVVAGMYIIVGAAVFVSNLYPVLRSGTLPPDFLVVELTELVAVVSGVFMLRGARWAQWLAFAWITFHVAISLDSLQKLIVHGSLLVVIACCLFHRAARAWFSPLS
jgi:hypothetical protein